MPILAQGMTQMGEFGFLAGPFAVEPSFGIRPALMRFVRPFLAMEIHFEVARLEALGVLRLVRGGLGLKFLGGSNASEGGAANSKLFPPRTGGEARENNRGKEL